MDKIAPTCATTRKAFLSHKTRDLEYRKVQLRKLYWAFKDNASLVEEACKKDLGKSQFETYLTEISWVMNDCIFMANNLDRFAKDEKPADIAFTNKFMGPRIRKDPLGAVLIIGAYNFPIQLTIGPLIGAIAAGCTAVIKPSESAPYAASVMQKIMAESLDPPATRASRVPCPRPPRCSTRSGTRSSTRAPRRWPRSSRRRLLRRSHR